MPVNVVHSSADEALWSRAKAAAKESSGNKDEPPWGLVMKIFTAMKKKHAHAHAKKADDAPTLPAGVRFQIGAANYDQAFQRGGAESKEDRRLRNAKPEHRAARREYMKTPEGKAVHRRAQESYRSANPSKVAAHHAARAEHGDNPSSHRCARCGKPAEHKHHPDYGDKTKVEWLCQKHHVLAHHPKSDLTKEKSMTETNDIFKSLMAGEILSKAGMGAPIVTTDADLRAAYKAEREARAAVRKAKADIAYAELLSKAEKHGHDQKAVDDEAEEASEKAEASRTAADDAVLKAEAAKTRVDGAAYAEYRKSRDLVVKALVNTEFGEAGLNSAQARSEGVRVGTTSGSDAREPRATSSMGMPSPEKAREQIFSGDDRPVDEQMDQGEGALERTIPGHSAASQLAELTRREAMSTKKSMISGLGALGGGAQQEALEARHDAAKSMSGAPEDIVFGLNPTQGDGLVATYSNAEDQRIMALMQKSEAAGRPGVFDDQTFMNRDAAVVKSIKCGLCKAMVPAMFASCPSCGGDHQTARVPGASAGQAIVLEKSVADSLRGPTEDEWRFPTGDVRIPAV